MSDVRVPLNNDGSPNQWLLYARATSFSVPVWSRASRPGSFDWATSFCSAAATSSLVRNSLVPNSFGRSSGVTYGLLQIPWRSGSPHEVRTACPASGDDTNDTNTNAHTNGEIFVLILDPPFCFTHLNTD